jgi:acetyl-CoA C-acetyltransferase
MTNVVIVSAARTAVGRFLGGLSSVPAHELGAVVIREVLSRGRVDAEDVDEVIFGHVLTAGQGQNPARKAAIYAGLPTKSTAFAVNQVCGSGLRAVAIGAQSLMCGTANVVVAGGQENMSLAPHAAALRTGVKMGSSEFEDTMIKDGLWDAFNNYHMGITAENVAEKYGISRASQDAFAFSSQEKAAAAIASGRFKEEIVPVTVKARKGDMIIDTDENPRATSLVDLAKLRPAFKLGGTVTAGNASGLNDGAAAVVLMTEEEATRRGLTPIARIASFATYGVDPSVMGTGPIPSSLLALKRAGWAIDDLDLIEANEAFAAQAIAVNNGVGWDTSKVNVNGGAIAIGHPIGASGARVLVTLLYEMQKIRATKGLATLCIGGGMGVALCVEAA